MSASKKPAKAAGRAKFRDLKARKDPKGEDREASAPSFSEIVVTKPSDVSSPPLFKL